MAGLFVTDAAAPAQVAPARPNHRRRVGPLGVRARSDRRVRVVSAMSLWAALLLVTYWWDADGGIRDLAGWASTLTSTGRLTGLWSAQLLLAQVLLMARLPVLENAYGRDRLTRIHRIVGFTSFTLMVAHIVLIIGGYASAQWSAVLGTSWDLLTDYGGVLLAAAGTICLIMVVVTSLRAARRRLRYESWHLLHLYAYLGVGLALPHQLWTGQEFLQSRGATVYWWTIWAATAAAVLVWRIGLPVARSLSHGLRVTSVVPEAPGVVSVYLTGRWLARLPLEAGQFLNVRFLSGAGWTRANPYSISAAPDGHSIRITAKVVGDGSRRLLGLRPGTRLIFEGPYGRLGDRARDRHRVLLMGAGVGITPLRALAEGLDYRPGEAVVLQRFSDRPLFAAEFDVLRRERGLQVIFLPGRRTSARSVLGPAAGNSELAALRHWVPDLAEREVFLCGPDPWTNAAVGLCRAAGVPEDRIHTERFGW
ncbi:ferredoxin reductase family protein [Microlunatus ginsengisoli]|uniref:Ferric reductase-like transmembrane domain-containing protein n=1 Tax=Microlunatus ginsengisoli TaxID=363863 RepID=A0ABP6ZIU0_9ACTN